MTPRQYKSDLISVKSILSWDGDRYLRLPEHLILVPLLASVIPKSAIFISYLSLTRILSGLNEPCFLPKL